MKVYHVAEHSFILRDPLADKVPYVEYFHMLLIKDGISLGIQLCETPTFNVACRRQCLGHGVVECAHSAPSALSTHATSPRRGAYVISMVGWSSVAVDRKKYVLFILRVRFCVHSETVLRPSHLSSLPKRSFKGFLLNHCLLFVM